MVAVCGFDLKTLYFPSVSHQEFSLVHFRRLTDVLRFLSCDDVTQLSMFKTEE